MRAQWDAEWERRLTSEQRRVSKAQEFKLRFDSKAQAIQRTEEAVSAQSALYNLLTDGLKTMTPFSWEALKDKTVFSEPRPDRPTAALHPPEPVSTSQAYKPKIGLLEFVFPQRKATAIATGQKRLVTDQENWSRQISEMDSQNANAEVSFQQSSKAWIDKREAFEISQKAHNDAVVAKALASTTGDEEAISELLDRTLDDLRFPPPINVNYELDYNADAKACVVDFNLPSPDEIPTLKEVRLIQTRNEFVEKHISESERSKIYESTLYQVALQVIGTLFAAESQGHLQRITFNGWVDYVDRATGMDERSCIMTVGANRADLDRIDLGRVDPKECFRSLKGISASKLIGLAPVAPLQRPRLVDHRFVESHAVASDVTVGTNIAAMDWQEFEHLVREVFQHIFTGPGSEVHVTQASRDGGVDAIIFDPDPIKGGKILVQAKRYTNTVGVSAVRDLFGTVQHEGASKGILVTTSDFGPDARKFADGKPLTLIDGSNLLSLLEQMGVDARIDLREAKATLALDG